MPDADQRELVGLGLEHYHLYTASGEALTYHEELKNVISRNEFSAKKTFDVRRMWKAVYSSLYTSFTAMSIVVNYVAFQRSFFKKTTPHVMNWMPGNILDEARKRNSPDFACFP